MKRVEGTKKRYREHGFTTLLILIMGSNVLFGNCILDYVLGVYLEHVCLLQGHCIVDHCVHLVVSINREAEVSHYTKFTPHYFDQ